MPATKGETEALPQSQRDRECVCEREGRRWVEIGIEKDRYINGCLDRGYRDKEKPKAN